jgi:hypothetical protein
MVVGGKGKVKGCSFSYFGLKPKFALVVFLDDAFAGKQAEPITITFGG